MTSNISIHLPSNKDETIGSTFRHKCFQIPIPTPRHDRYIWQDTLSISPRQTYSYDSHMRNRKTFTQPKISILARGTFGHIKRENYQMCGDLRRDIDASEHTSDRLCRTPQLMRKPKYSRNKSWSDLSDYVSSTSSSV